MRLTQPTDFLLLEALSDGERDTGANLAHHIEKDRSYINTRLPVLADYGLIQKVGPVEDSGLYQITPYGIAALEKRSIYQEDTEQFAEEVEQLAEHITISPPTIYIEDEPSK